MTTREDDIIELVKKHLFGELTDTESALLNEWLDDNRRNRAFFEYITSAEILINADFIYSEVDKLDTQGIFTRIQNQVGFINPIKNVVPAIHRVHFLKTAFFRAAVAVLLILTGFLIYYRFSHTSQTDKEMVDQPSPKSNDVMPGSTKAILTLSNGAKVELNHKDSEQITDGTLSIENKNGRLFYRNASISAINTMTTPQGGQYRVTLADGTRVWLNASSSITYPTAFNGTTREVTVSGEAYFEIAKNKAKPFFVRTPKELISVLGTSFNVNVYIDEPISKTSLVEGLIKINENLLRPGQALVNNRIIPTDIQQDLAWKNGQFSFQKADIPAVIRQLSRWYNIEVVFKGTPKNIITGKMGRHLTLQQVIKILQTLGVNCRLENKQLIVLQ